MRSLESRYWEKVDRHGENDCWPWLAAKSLGYGVIGVKRGEKWFRDYAHRIGYSLLVGPIPDGLEIDHLCRNRSCQNPAHMQPVTKAENVMRGLGSPARNARKTVCKRGHPLTPDNVYIDTKRGYRSCRTCALESERTRSQTTERKAYERARWERRNGDEYRRRRLEAKTHCSQGHEFKPETTFVNKRGRRMCLVCRPGIGRDLASTEVA